VKTIFKLLAFWAAVISVAGAQAQDFSIDWFGLAGGGNGSSLGGDFELSATIGQPEAGGMTGGDFAIIGGFWSIVAVEDTPGSPQLSIRLASAGVIISWPETGSAGFVLEEASTLTGPASSWTPVNASQQSSGGTITVSLLLGSGNHFYHLRKP
jgi:hypothetical protein